jgi:predicted phosphate transport protein (TIGR00153 family)
MRKIFGRESNVEKHSHEHVELVYQCVWKLKELMPPFYQGDFDILDIKVEEMSQLEHQADEIRRKMEIEFLKGAFLPFDREDRIILAELVDSVADMAQEAAYGISLSRITFPAQYHDDFSELVDEVCDSISILKECVALLDVDLELAIHKAHEVEVREEKVDRIEREIIKRLYQSYRDDEFGILKLIELKEMVLRMGNIVDRAEDASDRIPIIVAKRRG